jgi:hypothetical protein
MPKKPRAARRLSLPKAIAAVQKYRRKVDRQRKVRRQKQGAQVIEACNPIGARNQPEYEFIYRFTAEMERQVDFTAPAAPPFEIACVRILGGVVSLAADMRFAQRWRFQHAGVGDLSANVGLAPGEKLSLTIRKTQRTQLSETTVQSSESLDETESSIVDKDVLNVARSTSQSNQWHVDSNANFSIAKAFSVGASGGVSGSATATANTVVEHLSEATRKSSQRLQTLQKIEVSRVSETTLENVQQRVIENPYRDRSLALHIFELNKSYIVTTELAEVRPALVVEITDLALDREFVLSQGEFLDGAMVDRSLNAELRTALETARLPVSTRQRDLAREYARMASHMLFEARNIFNRDDGDPAENDPRGSFADDEGFDDALSNQAAKIFASLGFYYRLHETMYRLPPFPPGPLLPDPPVWQGPRDRGHDREVEFAVALADAIRDDWTALAADAAANLMDIGDRTEIIRRVPGFLSMVDGLLKPLLEVAKAEEEASVARDRAEDVIDRVVAHLHCNRGFYVRKFLEYLLAKTRGHAFEALLRDILEIVIANHPVPVPTLTEVLHAFAPLNGILDGYQFVVPSPDPMDPVSGQIWIDSFAAHPAPIMPNFVPREDAVTIPTDGVHIEAVPGNCILRDLPAPAGSVEANIDIRATGPAGP